MRTEIDTRVAHLKVRSMLGDQEGRDLVVDVSTVRGDRVVEGTEGPPKLTSDPVVTDVPRPLPRPPVPRGVRQHLAAAARHWRVKGAIQKVLGVMPGGRRIHTLLQQRVGTMRDFTRECDSKVDDWRLMMGHLRRARIDIAHSNLFEIGTGWYPTLPICLYLAGARHVTTVDLEPLVEPHLTLRMVERLALHLTSITKVSQCDAIAARARYATLLAALGRGATLADATNGCITYRAPADAARTELPPASIDVVFSNSVLEHVPPAVIESCFAEAMRILRPGGIVVHSVNCGDHYAYTDPSIDQLHYLTYSDEEWQKWDNAFLYQNRLRAADFTASCERAGFAIEVDTSRPHPDRLARLQRLNVHPRFQHYSREQLAITSIDFVGRKPGAWRALELEVAVGAGLQDPP